MSAAACINLYLFKSPLFHNHLSFKMAYKYLRSILANSQQRFIYTGKNNGIFTTYEKLNDVTHINNSNCQADMVPKFLIHQTLLQEIKCLQNEIKNFKTKKNLDQSQLKLDIINQIVTLKNMQPENIEQQISQTHTPYIKLSYPMKNTLSSNLPLKFLSFSKLDN